MRAILHALAVTVLALFVTNGAQAQSPDEVVWVQIEAQPSLAQATDRARAYSTLLQDVNGFALGGGWYGIVVGPYRRVDAELVRRQYVREGLVPRDSFIQLTSRLRQQFWPVGANVLQGGGITPPGGVTAVEEPQTPAADTDPAPEQDAPQVVQEPQLQPSDETVSEARASERDLDAQERRGLQIALKWAGFYNAGIDGAFGRGTRNSMAAWQKANNFEVTGILTTAQRAALLRQYNAVLEGLDMRLVRDTRAGIEVQMPTAEVAFEKYEAPFAHYAPKGEIGARVLLISQRGDRNTLFGLYDIMQTLEIVPLEGERSRRNTSFTITGRNARIVSETRVTLDRGQIKGFTLIWPAGDEERRTRVLAAMEQSFARLPAVLDDAEGAAEDQAIDLVSGLQIRQPRIARSGFFIRNDGHVATASEVVQSCGRLTLDGDTDAELVVDDPARGVAILRPRATLAPLAVARFNLAALRLQSEVSVAGYSYEGVLSAATLTFGTLAELRGLRGETDINRLSLSAQPGDAGGPVFDSAGNVIGMLLPTPQEGNRQLPGDVAFALKSEAIAEVAAGAGVSLAAADGGGVLPPRDLTIAAQGMTVLVSCWE